ncbi:MAG: SUMF1/EgtB/PvdO family nonheme iron enzyme [Polyangiaceae bacterium]
MCTADELAAACSSTAASTYPYGDIYDSITCNGVDRASTAVVVATGSLATCATPEGVLDLSGNLAEWTSTQTNADAAPGRIFQLHGGSYLSPSTGLLCTMELAPRALEVTLLPNIGFRCCRE